MGTEGGFRFILVLQHSLSIKAGQHLVTPKVLKAKRKQVDETKPCTFQIFSRLETVPVLFAFAGHL